jgi:hypothetical protein
VGGVILEEEAHYEVPATSLKDMIAPREFKRITFLKGSRKKWAKCVKLFLRTV